MSEPTTRRGYLLAALQAAGRPVRTSDVERLLAESPWSCHRNTARKDLRALTRRGALLRETASDGRHVYHSTDRKDVAR